MKGIIRRLRPSPAMVVACIALVFAMTGAGYAAGMLGPNTVGTKQLKKNAVISSKVKNRSLLAVDFKAGQLPRGAQGPQGPQGPPGAPNPNADTLNGYHANGLIRTALGAGPAYPSTVVLGSCGTTETSVAQVSIAAPGAGYVVVSGSVTARNTGAGGTVRAHLFPSTGPLSSYVYASVGSGAGQAALHTLSSHWVYQVAGAGTFTVDLRACTFAAGTDAFGGQVNAVYAPFGAAGAGPARPQQIPPQSKADPAGS
jgi:hypothetical protein